VCFWRAGGVCCHDNSKLRASIFTITGSVGAGSDCDHLQLIKFWRTSCALGKGSAGGGLALPYYSHCGLCASMGGQRRARSVCVSLSALRGPCVYVITGRRAKRRWLRHRRRNFRHPWVSIAWSNCKCRTPGWQIFERWKFSISLYISVQNRESFTKVWQPKGWIKIVKLTLVSIT